MGQDRPKSSDTKKSGLSRRVGSRSSPADQGAARTLFKRVSTKALLLHVLSIPIALVVIASLILGKFGLIVGGVIAFSSILGAARMMRRGLVGALEFDNRRVAKKPVPYKSMAHMFVAFGVFVLAWAGAEHGLVMSVVYAGLAALGSILAYGTDPRDSKDVDPALASRAGIDTTVVIEAIEEAEEKLAVIESNAREIHSQELVQRLARIVASGKRILNQIEKDPSDIRRARRFLITYLDGTRDVVAKYRDQQNDIADTPLGENFRHVLETVEQVFGEQEQVLKKNETLDLEIQIDVLRTQMEREGVV